jgi:integrase
MSRRGYGRGSVERHGQRWRVRVSADGRRVSLGSYDTRADAERMLAAYLAEVTEGAIVAPGSVTLRAWGREWLDRRELHGSRLRAVVRSVADERSRWTRHVEASELADLPLESITPPDVDDFAAWLRRRESVHTVWTRDGAEHRPTGRRLSARTQSHVLRLLRQCLGEAVAAGILERNPAAAVRVALQGTRDRTDDDWLRAEEIGRLLACDAIPERERAVYAAALGLALRQSDLRCLRVDDVRLDDALGPHVVVDVAKTATRHRVPVLPWLAPWLRAQLARVGTSPWVFPRGDGERYAAGYDFRWSEKRQTGKATRASALERAGIARRVTFHDLRGTCATHLALGTWGRRWSLHEVQRMLAHSDQRVTERYVRRAEDALLAAAAATPGGPTVPNGPSDPRGGSRKAPESLRWADRGSNPDQRCVKPTGRPMIPRAYPMSGADVGQIAADVLAAVAAGRVERAQLEALADAVLASPLVALAVEVRAGGPHAVARAVELAEALAADDDAEEAAS